METYSALAKIAGEYGSPFYIFYEERFTRNLLEFRGVCTQRYPDVVIAYSYKANYAPYLCRLARKLGAYAEVASRLELDLALLVGCPPAEIIYNGAVKRAGDIAFALDSGVMVNIDTMRELESVLEMARLHAPRPFKIGLRINIALGEGERESQVQHPLPVGRFGFSDSALEAAARMIHDTPNVIVSSLHGHSSSSRRSTRGFQVITARLAEVGATYFPDSIEYLNVGGGFFGRAVPSMGLADTPTYDDYAEAISEALCRSPWVETRRPTLVVEPGMAIAADTMSFFTRVFEVKQMGGYQLVVVDGSIYDVKPTMHQRNNPFTLFNRDTHAGEEVRYNVVGATCMEKDLILRDIRSPKIQQDDFIKIDNVGAYTVVMSPPFILPAPPIIVHGTDGYIPIRRRQDCNDIVAGYVNEDLHSETIRTEEDLG